MHYGFRRVAVGRTHAVKHEIAVAGGFFELGAMESVQKFVRQFAELPADPRRAFGVNAAAHVDDVFPIDLQHDAMPDLPRVKIDPPPGALFRQPFSADGLAGLLDYLALEILRLAGFERDAALRLVDGRACSVVARTHKSASC